MRSRSLRALLFLFILLLAAPARANAAARDRAPARDWATNEPGEVLGLLVHVRTAPPAEIFSALDGAARGEVRRFPDAPAGLAGSAEITRGAGTVRLPFLPRLHLALSRLPAEIFFREILRDPFLSAARAEGTVELEGTLRFQGEWKFEGTARFEHLSLRDPENRFLIENLSGEVPFRLDLAPAGARPAPAPSSRSVSWGRLSAGRLVLLGEEIGRDLPAQARIEGGVLSLRGIEGDAFGGRVRAGLAFDSRRSDSRFALLLSLSGIELEKLSAFFPPDVSATGRLSGDITVMSVGGVPVRASGLLRSLGPGEIRLPERLRRRARDLPETIPYRSLEIRLAETPEGGPRAIVRVEASGSRTLLDLLRGASWSAPRYVFDIPLTPLLVR